MKTFIIHRTSLYCHAQLHLVSSIEIELILVLIHFSSQWYQSLKKITSFDQQKNEQPNVAEISHLSNQQQAEMIAEKFASIPNEYQPLKSEDISIPSFTESEIPQFLPQD